MNPRSEVSSRPRQASTHQQTIRLILKELNKNGLLTQDAAPFLRERILKDPDLELDDEEFEDGADTNYVVQNIDVIEQAIERLQTKKIQHASRASLARILSNMGMNARARDLIEAALQGMDEMLVEQGGHHRRVVRAQEAPRSVVLPLLGEAERVGRRGHGRHCVVDDRQTGRSRRCGQTDAARVVFAIGVIHPIPREAEGFGLLRGHAAAALGLRCSTR
mgnify:CR=1 FL=1